MIDRREYVHYKKIIHRDIKLLNFVMGRGSKSHILHLIDFGLATKYWSSSHKCYIPFNSNRNFTGNSRYCSLNLLKRFEPSRIDDLESIGYAIICLLRGRLPWQEIRASNLEDLLRKVVEKRLIMSVKEICSGLPSELATFISYTRNIEFAEAPDYNYLRYLLKNIIKKSGFTIDFYYDWFKEKPNIQSNDPIFANDLIKYDRSKEWLFDSTCHKKDCLGMDLV